MNESDILVFAEVASGTVAGISHELLGAARELTAATGGQVVVLLMGKDVTPLAEELKEADRILVIDDPHLAGYAPEPYARVLESVVGAVQPRAVLVGTTTVGLDIAPLIAARLDAALVKNCQRLAMDGATVKATSNLCGGKLLADVAVEGSPAVVLILPGSFHPSTSPGLGEVEVMPTPVPLGDRAIHFEEMVLPEAGDVDITQEECLIAIGRGVQQQDNVELAEELAEALGAQLAGSRPVIDQGWLPATRQVGKSGMIVKPKLYLALGISGAPEHQEGMQNSDLIIAVNTDPDAPIFDVAHYGTELDLLDLVPALTEAVANIKGGG